MFIFQQKSYWIFKNLNTIYNSIKNVKYFKINLTRYVQDLYARNYKILLRKIKEDINQQRDIPHSWIKGQLLLCFELSVDSLQPQSKSQPAFLQKLENDSKIYRNVKKKNKTRIANAISKRKSKSGGPILHSVRFYYTATFVKNVFRIRIDIHTDGTQQKFQISTHKCQVN